MRYKDKNDIDFRTFEKFSKVTTGVEDISIPFYVNEFFYHRSVVSDFLTKQFSKALDRPYKFLHVLKIDFNTIGNLIDCENYLIEENYEDLIKLIVKPKYFWRKVDMSVGTVHYAVSKLKEALNDIKTEYPWIYNPPTIGIAGFKNTIGSDLRKEFAEFYGGYMELVYLVSKGDMTKMNEILEMDARQFLFIGEYLNRKKLTEKIE